MVAAPHIHVRPSKDRSSTICLRTSRGMSCHSSYNPTEIRLVHSYVFQIDLKLEDLF